MISSSHIYGLYKKHRICEGFLSSDQKLIALSVIDQTTQSYSINIYDLKDLNMIQEVSDTRQMAADIKSQPLWTTFQYFLDLDSYLLVFLSNRDCKIILEILKISSQGEISHEGILKIPIIQFKADNYSDQST